MQTKKLNLRELKVESFITSLGEIKSQTVKGGSGLGCAVISLAAAGAVSYTVCKEAYDATKAVAEEIGKIVDAVVEEKEGYCFTQLVGHGCPNSVEPSQCI